MKEERNSFQKIILEWIPKGKWKGRSRMTGKKFIEESLKANKLSNDIELDRKKLKRSSKNTFIHRGNPLLSGNY